MKVAKLTYKCKWCGSIFSTQYELDMKDGLELMMNCVKEKVKAGLNHDNPLDAVRYLPHECITNEQVGIAEIIGVTLVKPTGRPLEDVNSK